MKTAATRSYNPAQTRERVLKAAFEEIHREGFRSADLGAILKRAGVTKGALYHHFASKEALGYAVFDELIAPMQQQRWRDPLAAADDPIEALIGLVKATSGREEDIQRGCPLNNLAQEMAPVDEGFRQRTASLFENWRKLVAEALRRGQKSGAVRGDIDIREEAAAFVALYEGFLSMAKSAQDPALLRLGKKVITDRLRALRR